MRGPIRCITLPHTKAGTRTYICDNNITITNKRLVHHERMLTTRRKRKNAIGFD
jgi:hypothetical protein